MPKAKSKLVFYLPFLVVNILNFNSVYFRYISFVLFFVPTLLLLRKKISKKYILLIAFLLFQFMVSWVTTGIVQSLKNSAQFVLYFAPVVIFDLVIKEEWTNEERRAVYPKINAVVQITYVYCLIASWKYVQTSMYSIRNMASYDPSLGINPDFPFAIGGGYSLLFPLTMFLVLFLWAVFQSNLKFERVLYVALIAFSLLLLIKANCTTALLIAVVCMGWKLVCSKTPKKTIGFLLLAVFIVLFLLVQKTLLTSGIEFVANLFNKKSIIYQRLNEIVPAIYGGESSSSFGIRLYGLQKDVNTIFKFPILGAGGELGFDYFTLSQYVGWHSQWLDIFAEFGIPLSCLFFAFLIISIREVYSFIRIPNQKGVFIIMAMGLFFMGIADPVMTRNMFLVLFVIYPSIYVVIEDREKSKAGINETEYK